MQIRLSKAYATQTPKCLKEMEKIKVENLGKKYDLRYALTNKQKQILSFYELTLPDVREYVSTVNRTLTYIEK